MFKRGINAIEDIGLGIVSKWTPLLESTNIDKKYYTEVAFFTQRIFEEFAPYQTLTGVGVGQHSLGSAPPQNEFEENMISISLLIINKLGDLGRVRFSKAPFYFIDGEKVSIKEKKWKISMGVDDIHQLSAIHGWNVADTATGQLIDLIADDIKEKLLLGLDIFLYLPIQSISYKTEENNVNIYFTSRYSYIKKEDIEGKNVKFWEKNQAL